MKTCLVVDDSGVVRKIARRILEELAFNVSEAGDGMEALERCSGLAIGDSLGQQAEIRLRELRSKLN